MITEKELDNLKSFGKESDGSYSDRWDFTLKKIESFNAWWLFFFNEVDGSLRPIKRLKDMADLKNVYKAITDKELE